MADDTTGTNQADAPPDPPATGELGDAGKRAIAAERRARQQAERDRDQNAAALKEFQDRDKTDQQRAAETAAAAERRALDAELRATRLEVAAEKGLTASQARRLVGTTREEIEADAEEFLRDLPVVADAPPGTVRRPVESLRSGAAGGATAEDADPLLASLKQKLHIT